MKIRFILFDSRHFSLRLTLLIVQDKTGRGYPVYEEMPPDMFNVLGSLDATEPASDRLSSIIKVIEMSR